MQAHTVWSFVFTHHFVYNLQKQYKASYNNRLCYSYWVLGQNIYPLYHLCTPFSYIFNSLQIVKMQMLYVACQEYIVIYKRNSKNCQQHDIYDLKITLTACPVCIFLPADAP